MICTQEEETSLPGGTKESHFWADVRGGPFNEIFPEVEQVQVGF